MQATAVAAESAEGHNPESGMRLVEATAERLLAGLRAFDFKSYEPLSADAAVDFLERGAAHHIEQSVGEVMKLLQRLPYLVLGRPIPLTPRLETIDEVELTLGDPVEGVPAPAHDRFNEEVDEALASLTAPAAEGQGLDPEHLEGVLHMLVMQLAGVRDRLRAARAHRSKWSMITEGEDARRKSEKALHYGLLLAARVVGLEEPLLASPVGTELEIALNVRNTLLAFRRDLLHITAELPHCGDADLSIMMRDIRIRMLELFLSPQYQSLRAHDRYQIQALRTRVGAWLDGVWDHCDEARRVLGDLRGFAELLLSVNQRELLVQHDRRILTECLRDLGDLAASLSVSSQNGWIRYAAVLSELGRVAGRDAELDQLVDAERRAGACRPQALLRRIDELSQRLNAVRT